MNNLSYYSEYKEYRNWVEYGDGGLLDKCYKIDNLSYNVGENDFNGDTNLEKCIFCKTQLQLFEEEAKEFKAYYEIEYTNIYVCPNCGWWSVFKKRVYKYTSYAISTVFRNGILKRYDIASKDIPTSILRIELEKRFDSVHTVNPIKFELLVRDVYKDFYNCEVIHVGGPGDNGVDLFAIIKDEPVLIQVKRRKNGDYKELPNTVRELIGSMILHKTQKAHLVTTAKFGNAAIKSKDNDILKKQNIDISFIGKEKLFEMLRLTREKVEAFPIRNKNFDAQEWVVEYQKKGKS